MTYVSDERRRAIPAGKPVSRSPLGPQNSLDYWQKAKDRQGVTYFWNNPYGGTAGGLENVYVAQTTRRPAPFPLSLPPTTKTQRSPQPRSASALPIYHNIPRARLAHNKTDSTNESADTFKDAGTFKDVGTFKDSPVFPSRTRQIDRKTEEKQEPKLIWSISPNNGRQQRIITNDPLYLKSGLSPTPGYIYKGDKTRSRTQKPRWGRFVQSLCCCVTPQRELEKPAPRAATSPASLITQVQKNGAAIQQNEQPVTGKQNDYSQTPAVPVISPPISQIKPCERFLLPPLRPADANKKCLIIDLDETLVHSSFKPVKNADFVIPVEIDGIEHKVYVLKRPYVDDFLARVGERYECVLFTASLAKYADPVADLLDKRGVFRSRLFREACVYNKGNYVKDLGRLGRDLQKVLIIDNSPASYAFHPDNAIPVQTWFDDPTDVELLDILPLLDRMEKQESVYDVLRPRDTVNDSLLENK